MNRFDDIFWLEIEKSVNKDTNEFFFNRTSQDFISEDKFDMLQYANPSHRHFEHGENRTYHCMMMLMSAD